MTTCCSCATWPSSGRSSLFDNFYLGFMRDLRDRYGTKTHINIYYAYEDFDLRQMPDTYKSEWRDNADWLQLSFHARHRPSARSI